MILILSQSGFETTTERVMDWLEAAGAPHRRVNGRDLSRDARLDLQLDGCGTSLRLENEGEPLDLDAVDAVWARRWSADAHLETLGYFEQGATPAPLPHTAFQIQKQLSFDLHKLSEFFFERLRDRPWLTRPGTISPNKLTVLERAVAHGMDIPATLVTTERAAVSCFVERFERVITKVVGEVDIFPFEDATAMLYTALLDAAAVAALPEHFFPSLFQEAVSKSYEIRVFYLDGRCDAMAIFSQADAQTAADFRNYNYQKPNRNVPYRLPARLETKVRALMDELELDTGSLDFMKAQDGRDIFLEVNPVGQFGMVSLPCNYHLEKQVAEYLVRLATGYEAARRQEAAETEATGAEA